jgi:hypothetical protein
MLKMLHQARLELQLSDIEHRGGGNGHRNLNPESPSGKEVLCFQ